MLDPGVATDFVKIFEGQVCVEDLEVHDLTSFRTEALSVRCPSSAEFIALTIAAAVFSSTSNSSSFDKSSGLLLSASRFSAPGALSLYPVWRVKPVDVFPRSA